MLIQPQRLGNHSATTQNFWPYSTALAIYSDVELFLVYSHVHQHKSIACTLQHQYVFFPYCPLYISCWTDNFFFMLKSFCANDDFLNSYEFCVWLNSDTEGRYKIPLTPTFCSVQVTDQKNNTTLPFDERNGKISTQPHTILCIQFLDRQNNDKNNTRPLRKQICFTIVWGSVEILPKK